MISFLFCFTPVEFAYLLSSEFFRWSRRYPHLRLACISRLWCPLCAGVFSFSGSDARSQACFPLARFRRICLDRRAVLALCCRFTSAVEVVAVDGSATQPLFRRHLRPLSFCGTTVSPLLRRHRRTPSGGRGAWRSGPSSSSLLLFPPLMVGEL